MGKKSSRDPQRPPRDLVNYPHAELIPPPIAAWDYPPQLQVDYTQVYTNPGVTAPPYLAGFAQTYFPPILEAYLRIAASVGLPITETHSADTARIWIAFYFQPWPKQPLSYIPRHSPASVDDADRQTTALPKRWPLPGPHSDYNGAAYIVQKSKAMMSVSLWLNLVIIEYFKRQAEANPDVPTNWQRSGRDALYQTMLHEGGHALGLTDDYASAPDDPAMLMNYRNMLSEFHPYEIDVLRHIYGGGK